MYQKSKQLLKTSACMVGMADTVVDVKLGGNYLSNIFGDKLALLVLFLFTVEGRSLPSSSHSV